MCEVRSTTNTPFPLCSCVLRLRSTCPGTDT